ncbi:hypothetical protein EUTSA_v10022409mg [Eutrema salsugineum]|uniref:Uncharacterized protein n=1 Tax=Eutrema salsugineum TaxID=72664 RepID=V4M454_EUTSA|nr:hypothetical protein EUTSA_v10022409mg [Eutrema salsugineum]
MARISMKLAFILFLTVTSVMMSIVTTEAKRLLPEETRETVLHHEALTQDVVKQPKSLHCKIGCRVRCVPNPFIIECFCQC